MRRFTCTEGGSDKFWDIDLKGKSFTVTYGRTGTRGRSQTREFADEAAARKEHDKLIRQKLAGGYREVIAGPGPGGSSGREALERALVENPDDLAAHAAYADLLVEEGNPRGEFIQVQLALEDQKRSPAERKKLQGREQELLELHRREWLGELTPLLLDYDGSQDWRLSQYGADRFAEYQFRRGWLDRLHLNYLSLPAGRILRGARVCRMLRDLAITSAEDNQTPREPGDGIPGEREYPAGLWPLAQSPYLGNVRTFRLGVDDGDEWESYHCSMHTAAVVGLVRAMPRLEELRLFANGFRTADLFALPTLTRLRVLQLHHGLGVHRLHVLADNPAFRSLTHLLVHPHNADAWWENSEADEADGYREEEGFLPLSVVRPLLHSANLVALRHLRLRCSSMGDEGCQEIVRSGILRRLQTLDLRHGRVTDAGAEILADCPDTRRLEYLDLDRNALGPAGVARVKGLGIPVRVENQQTVREVGEGEYLREGEFE